MERFNYQTVRLSKGQHSSPAHGACVMELASMLAGEPFSDQPRAVCRALGSFLRSYNDLLDDRRRQDLYEYAAEVVGTAGGHELSAARAQRLVQWADETRRSRRSAISALLKAFRRAPEPGDEKAAARYAIGAIGPVTDASHRAVLDLIDELIDIGLPPQPFSTQAEPRVLTVRDVQAARRVR